MNKILVIYDFFENNNRYIPKIFDRFLKFLKSVKIKRFLGNLIKKGKKRDTCIDVICPYRGIGYDNDKINFLYYASLRSDIKHELYSKLKEKVKLTTHKILQKLYEIQRKYELLTIKDLDLIQILEFRLKNYLNSLLGQIEILKLQILTEKYDQVIFYNCDPQLINILHQQTNQNLDLTRYVDKSINKLNYFYHYLNSFTYSLILIGSYVKNTFRRRRKTNLNPKDILFAIHTKNQFNSVKSIYKRLYKNRRISTGFYYFEYFLRPNNIMPLFHYLIRLNKYFKKEFLPLIQNIVFSSINVSRILDIIFYRYLIPDFIQIFNFYTNLDWYVDNSLPEIVIIANDFNVPERVALSYFNKRKVKIVYIPHAAIPIFDEFVYNCNIDYLALGGEADINYYLAKGIARNNILVAGIPRYERFYQGKISKVEKVIDMFSGREYDINTKEHTILLTTNPIDDTSNELIIKNVVNSLIALNLIDHLIIKLHPSESGRIHQKVLRELNVNPIIVRDYNILDLINSCDLLISQKSTTLLEAMLIGTPMILLDFINKDFTESSRYEFLNENFVKTVKNQKQLTEEIKTLIINSDAISTYCLKLKDYVKGFSFYESENPPTQKIADFVLDLLKK
jgi:hypothetical protein